MSNDYFNETGEPQPRARGASATIREQFVNLEKAFDLLPDSRGVGLKGFDGGVWANGTFENPTLKGGSLGTASDAASVNASAIFFRGEKLPADIGAGNLGFIRRVSTEAQAVWVADAKIAAIFSLNGDIAIGDGSNALVAAATAGFFFLPAISGTPSGTPRTYPSSVACAIDPTTNKLWARCASGWKSTTLT